jgi:DNA-binding response OmpR family regulator
MGLLFIDDDIKLTELTSEYLSKFGMKVTIANNPELGLKLLAEEDFELVLLDVMMPGKDGFQVCREIRAKSQIPIIMLTARGEVTDRIVGLELGADDYLAKPFEPRELYARIQAILRRISVKSDLKPHYLISHNLTLDLQKRSAELDKSDLGLTSMEFEFLKVFMEHPQVAFDRDQLMDKIKGVDWEAFDRSIDITISRLRQKLNDPVKTPRFIKTIWGTGYMYVAPVKAAEVNS